MIRSGDRGTTELITDVVGSVTVEHREDVDGWGNKTGTQEKQESHPERERQQFTAGEAVLRVPGGFAHGRIKPWDHLSAGEQRPLGSN